MRRALAGCAVAAAIGATWTVTEAPPAEVAAPPTPAEAKPAQVALPEAAPDTTTTTTTAPVEVEPILCPSLGHPAHHQPCPPDEPISPQSRTVRPGGDVWERLADCETGGTRNPATDTGNGFSGALQFAPGTWVAYGGLRYAPRASQATFEQQVAVAQAVQADQGWAAWPACSRAIGVR